MNARRQPASAKISAAESADGATNTPSRVVLEAHDLRVVLARHGRRIVAVDGLTYQLRAGRTLAIIGESGSGKSVSCLALMGLLPQSARVSGSIRLDGRELLALPAHEMRLVRGAQIAMVFQDADRALNPTMRIGYQITEAVRAHEQVGARAARERAVELLRTLGLLDPQRLFFAYPHELSGGMRQRVMIAIALAANPKVLIADETARSLDPITRVKIMELLTGLQGLLGMALILVSHDLNFAARFADDVIVLYAGKPFEHAPAHELFKHPRTPYTKALLDAIPRFDAARQVPFGAVHGQQADPEAPPLGCPFAPRCPRAAEPCAQRPPALERHDGSHHWACWYPYAALEAR